MDLPKSVKSVQEILDIANYFKIPLEETCRFFVGIDTSEPKSYGIFYDVISDEWVVYKNLADGSRTIRYKGKNESTAANILWKKFLNEYDLRYPNRNPAQRYSNHTSANRSRHYRRSTNHNSAVKVVFVTFIVLFVLMIVMMSMIGFMLKSTESGPRRGYYDTPDGTYYYDNHDWFYYDDLYDDWILYYGASQWLNDYYSPDYDTYNGYYFDYPDDYYYDDYDDDYYDDWDDDDSWYDDYDSDWDDYDSGWDDWDSDWSDWDSDW